MAKTILVVVNPETSVRLLLQRLESVLKPGHRLVFLLRSQLDKPMWLLAQVASVQTGFDNGQVWHDRAMQRPCEEQRIWAEQNLAEPARRAFNRIGVEIEVDLYQRSLTSSMKRYLKTAEITLILVAGSSWLQRAAIVPIMITNWIFRRLHGQGWSRWLCPLAKTE